MSFRECRIKDGSGNDVTNNTSHVGYINPLRYRGYYYDIESGLFYVGSRYYNPEIGRFLNADGLVSTGQGLTGYNMFAYSANNAVNRSDSTGMWFGLDDLVTSVVGAAVGLVGQYVSDVIQNNLDGKVGWDMFKATSSAEAYFGAALGGAAGAMTLLYTANPIAAGMVCAGTTTLVGQGLEKLTGRNDRAILEIAINTGVDTLVGGFVGNIVPGTQGITAGRNSFQAVFTSGLTKLGNKTAKSMSAKVVVKGIVATTQNGLGLDFYYGLRQYSNDDLKTIMGLK